MAPLVELAFDADTVSWEDNDVWGPDGVLAGLVTLKLRGQTILDSEHVGLNSSALSLLRALTQNHVAVASEAEAFDAPQPLFFCAGALANHCGVVHDFSVMRHADDVILSAFWDCEVPSNTVIQLPWLAWAEVVTEFASRVLERLPRVTPPIVSQDYREAYVATRDKLHTRLDDARERMRNSE